MTGAPLRGLSPALLLAACFAALSTGCGVPGPDTQAETAVPYADHTDRQDVHGGDSNALELTDEDHDAIIALVWRLNDRFTAADAEGYYSNFCQARQQQVRRDVPAHVMQDQVAEFGPAWGRVDSIEVNDGTVTAWTTSGSDSSSSEPTAEPLIVVREDGKWKACWDDEQRAEHEFSPAENDTVANYANKRFGRIAAEYRSNGVTEDLARRLHDVASRTNYGVVRNEPIPDDIYPTVVHAMLMRCDDIRTGYITWQDAVDEDMFSGASSSDATTLNRFLREEFCPHVR